MTDTAEIQGISDLSAKQMAALPLLASGMRYAAVAKQVEVTHGTIKNWCSQNPQFKAELRARQRQLYVESHTRLQALAHEATQALRDVLTDQTAAARDRVAAARTVLGHVHDKQQTHTIRSSGDAAALIAKILNESEFQE